jgi:hypothetical protein
LTPSQHRNLDRIADRLGELYQRLGVLQDRYNIDDTDFTLILNELVSPTEEVEHVSGRKERVTAAKR